MTEKTATSETWKHISIDKPKKINVDLFFTYEQFEKIKRGLIPKEMEDKWFIYFDKGWLYFHRSWTGFGIYKAQIREASNGYRINEFWAERNEEKYSNDDDQIDIETFTSLIARGLLGLDLRKPYH